VSSRGADADTQQAIQGVVDALSIAICRPVLVDDPSLALLAYSRQSGEIDEVRASSILSRVAPPAVREALLAQGIARATDVVHTSPDAALGMAERVCVPVRAEGALVAYIWILDPETTLGDDDLDQVRRASRQLGTLFGRSGERWIPDETSVLQRLVSSSAGERSAAAAELRERGALLEDPVVLCLLAGPRDESEPVAVAHQVVQRLSVSHAIAGRLAEGGAVVVSTGDPVVRTVHPDEVAAWLHASFPAGLAVGQSAPVPLERLNLGLHQARVALRVARSRRSGDTAATWRSLGADRLIAQLPVDWRDDVPERLARLLVEESALAMTLEAFLDAAGDVKATAQVLSLHRSGVYYRLKRIEELTGLVLARGEDRLLAHLAIRAEHLFR
jgi:hypothetical protein